MVTFGQAVKKYSKDNGISMTGMFTQAGVEIRHGSYVSNACNHDRILEVDYKKLCKTFRIVAHETPVFVSKELSELRRKSRKGQKSRLRAEAKQSVPASAEVAFRHEAVKVPERYIERGFRYQQASLALLLDKELRSKALEFVHAAQDMGYNVKHMVRTLEN